MRIYDVITKKKSGLPLTKEEIEFFINGYVDGSIPDYQISPLLMAICFKGMTDEETVFLTDSMMRSGETLDLSVFGDKSVDKHSTGGVGDKTTLIIAPIVASIGGKVAKMSGRGLGHTGGTIDKLESISGFSTSIEADAFFKQVEKIGVAVVGQTANLVPADKKLYALRDVTATVDSIPLIASSIMSKKLASGAASILLDVKVGSGAFMKSVEEAKKLAELMIFIGKKLGRNVSAMITNMDVPLGRYVGNSLEVYEAVSVLEGGGDEDIKNITRELAAKMISLSCGYEIEKARELVDEAIRSGAAIKKFKEWVIAQGADKDKLDDGTYLPVAKNKVSVLARADGYISKMDTEKIGICACMTGAGRESKSDVIDLSAGIEILAKTGDYVKAGDELAIIYTAKENTESMIDTYLSALEFSSEKVDYPTLIYDVLG